MANPALREEEGISYSQPAEIGQSQELISPQQGETTIGLPGPAGDNLPSPTLPAPQAAPPQPSSNTVDKRAFKINYSGLAALIGQTEDGVKSAIAAGQEDWIRSEAASRIDSKNAEIKHQKILQAFSAKGSPLNPDEVLRALDPYNPAFRAADPNEVIERAYATTYVSAANTAAGYMQDNFLDKAKGEIPDQVQNTESKTVDLAAIREFVHTKVERLQDEYDKQGWIGWSANQIQLLFQPYSEYKLRALMKEIGVVSGGVLLPDNIESTVDAIYASPDPKAEITRILDGMKDNPTLQLMFAQTLLGSSTSEKNLGRVFSVLGPLDILAAGGVAKRLLTKVGLFDKTQRAYRDVAKSLEIEHPTEATIAETVGNTEQAAILRVADNITKESTGNLDPTKIGRESLMSGFRQTAELLANNIGSFSREAVVRLQDGIIRSGQTLIDTQINKSKVQRTPLAFNIPENLTAIKDKLAGDLRGTKNTLLDIGDPIPNEITGTHEWPVRYGNYDNKLFSSEEVAHNFAEQDLKISGYELGRREGEVETAPARFVGSKTDLAAKTRLEKSLPETERALKQYVARAKEAKTAEERADILSHVKGEEGIRAILKRDRANLIEINKRITTLPSVVNQKGIGFYIERRVPFNEGDSLVKNLMVKDLAGNFVKDAIGTSSASGFNNIMNGVFGWFRGANQTLSKNEMMQRNAATFSAYGLRNWAKQEGQALVDIAKGKVRFDEVTGEPIPWYRSAPRPITGKLTSEEVKEQFVRTLKFAQDAPDPHNNGEPGYFFRTLGELSDHYLTYYQRPPSYNEANAYTSFVKLVEAERVLMEVSEYKYRSRLGVEQHQFTMKGPNNTKINSGFVDGVERKVLPRNGENVLVMGDKVGDERLYSADRIPTNDRKRLDEQILNGQRKVVQIYATGQRPLANFSKIAANERIVYVVADNIETKPLGYNHVNRRAGGHFDFEYDHAVKQPIMTHTQPGAVSSDKRGSRVESLYEGDRTFALADNRAQGKDFARRINEVVELIDARKMDEAQAKFNTNKLGMEWDRFKGFFVATKGPDGRTIMPRYSTKEKFEVVPKNSQIIDLPTGKDLEAKYRGTFRDGTKSGDLSKQFQVNYNRERAEDRVYAITDKGKPGRPDYEYQPASIADPIATFDRSFKRMINSTFMDDYKIYTVEHWLQEAAPYLKPKESELRSAPFAHFNTPEWRSGLDKIDLMKKSNLLSNRYKAREFIGLPSKFDTTMYQLTQHIADTMWEATHPAVRGALLIPHWLLPYHAEPAAVIRSMAYHFKLGLYALPQILTQFNSWTTTIALEPRAGAAGTYAALLHSWASVNSTDKVLEALDKSATKLDMGKITLGSSRWRPGEFLEARKELIRSEFSNVGGEIADLDNVFNNHSVIQGSSAFARGGQKPFQWGEKAARIPAYYTAFRSFREDNPFKALTELDRQKILRHANILTNNMTRASNSIMNEGIASLPMQFLNYTYRLGETFFGKEIGETTGERALARVRLMATYGAMYGLPSAVGVTGIPLGDKARKYALDNFGYIPGEHWYSTAVMEGWPALFLNKVSGGSNYNVGPKWGTGGMTSISDLLRSDKSWWEIVGGAGISNIYKFLSGFDGYYKAMISFAKQDPADTRFKLTFDDIIKPALQIASVNTFRRGYVGVTTGKWIATNDAPVMDVSKANAIFMGVTGLSPTEQSDAWLKGQIRNEEKSMQKDALKSFLEDMARADMAAKAKDPEAAEVFHRNAFATLHVSGFSYEKMLAAISQAARNKGNSIDRSDYDFYLGRDVPQDKARSRKDTYVRLKQLQQGNQ